MLEVFHRFRKTGDLTIEFESAHSVRRISTPHVLDRNINALLLKNDLLNRRTTQTV